MNNFLNAQEAGERFDTVQREIEEKVYEVCAQTESILSWAIETAMRQGQRDISITSYGYEIEEWWGYIEKFLKQNGYQNVIVEERGYSCFDDNRGVTQIVFSF